MDNILLIIANHFKLYYFLFLGWIPYLAAIFHFWSDERRKQGFHRCFLPCLEYSEDPITKTPGFYRNISDMESKRTVITHVKSKIFNMILDQVR